MKNQIKILKFLLFIFLPINFFAYRITYYKGYKVVDGELLVKFKEIPSTDVLNKFKIKHILKHINSTSFKNWYAIRFDGAIQEQLEIIKNNPLVEYVEPNYIFRIFFSSTNDPYYNNQKKYLEQIKLPPAWQLYYSQYITYVATVAVLDTGVDGNHEDLAGNIDRVNSASVSVTGVVIRGRYQDDHYEGSGKHSHGTHVSGIIAAVVNNAKGVAGICPKVKLMAVKVLNNKGEGNSLQISEGIKYAANKGAKVINLSLGLEPGTGTEKEIKILKEAIDHADKKGCLVVAAAGNDGIAQLAYPARYEKTLSVGSVNIGDARSKFSNYGSNLDIMAPGENIYSTVRSDLGLYDKMDGTSMSAPIVSGIACLLLSLRPDLSANDLETILKITADDIGEPEPDATTGHGRANAYKALHHLLTRQEIKLVKSVVFPNPFVVSDRGFIAFDIPREISGANLEITIFNFAGEIITKIDEPIWYGKDDKDEYVPSGLYFYRLKTDRGISTGKFTVINR